MNDLLDRLASSLGRRDDGPNKALARSIAMEQNEAAVAGLIAGLKHKQPAIQSDCIKVLYETGLISPELIAPYTDDFVSMLKSKNNRLQWGAMKALHALTAARPAEIFAALPAIADAAYAGSVITKDQAVDIMVILCAFPEYIDHTAPLLNEQILRSAVNQLPTYAEKAAEVIPVGYRSHLLRILQLRLPEVTQESKRKRLEGVIRKLGVG